MKKFLSMVLALVMAMSLVTISSSAAFTDAADIDYKEAVDVMTAVGIVDGYADGSFGPDGYLSRGAAAKIICNMILGVNNNLPTSAAPYSDVPAGSTFAGYIAYCQNEGIVSGYADGTFKPGNQLTGFAFMKMLLGALGYDSDIEVYTGNNWSVSVAKDGKAAGLYNGFADDVNFNGPITRQEALQMAFNAMKATLVQYPSNTSIVVGDIKVTTTAEHAKVPQTVVADYGLGDTNQQFCEEHFSGLKAVRTNDAYGRPATKWTWKTTTNIGTYVDKATLVYTNDETLYTVRTALGVAATEAPVFTVYVNNESPIVVDDLAMPYKNSATSNAKLSNWLNGDFTTAYYAPTGRGIVTEVYYNAVTKTGTIVIIDELINKVNAVKTDDNGRYVTIYGEDSALKFYSKDLNKGDVVLYTKAYNAGATKIASAKVAEMVTGSVTWLTDASNGYYFYTQLDGVAYYNHGDSYMNSLAIGQVINAWLDSNGYIIKTELTEASVAFDKLVLLTDKIQPVYKDANNNEYLGAWTAKAIYGDGKSEVVTLAPVSAAASEDVITNYTTASGAMKIVATNGYTSTSYSNTTYKFTTGQPKVSTDAGYKMINVDSATGFVYIDETDATVKTFVGYKNAPTFTGATKVVALTDNDTNLAVVVYVFVDNDNLVYAADELIWAMTQSVYRYTTTINGEVIEYYGIKTLDGTTIKVDADVWTGYLCGSTAKLGSWYAYYLGAVPFSSVTYHAGTDVIDTVTVASGLYYGHSYSGLTPAVVTINDVLHFSYVNATTDAVSSTWTMPFADDVAVYVVASNGLSFYEEDVASLEGKYYGFIYHYNENVEIDTLVLKEIAAAGTPVEVVTPSSAAVIDERYALYYELAGITTSVDGNNVAIGVDYSDLKAFLTDSSTYSTEIAAIQGNGGSTYVGVAFRAPTGATAVTYLSDSGITESVPVTDGVYYAYYPVADAAGNVYTTAKTWNITLTWTVGAATSTDNYVVTRDVQA